MVISVSHGTLTRIQQQYNMSTKQATIRKSTIMSVDDSVLTNLVSISNHMIEKTGHPIASVDTVTVCSLIAVSKQAV